MYVKVKRLLDFTISFVGLVFLSPLFILIALMVKFSSKGPVVFNQKRYGKNSKLFSIYKFRTMKIDAPLDIPTHLFEDESSWLTPVGKVLRRLDLDELPQLLNILKGEMSFVGPRPALWNQYDLMEMREKAGVNSVQVGLTGWAQVNGRDEISMSEKVELDREYAENFGFVMDIKCILKTFSTIISHGGRRHIDETNTDNR